MKTLFLAIPLLFLTALPVQAELQSSIIEYRQERTTLEGYLIYDDQFTGKRPGVLVVHEWMGLNDYAKSRANQLARLGYVAFAPDIYGQGVRPSTPEAAGAESGKYKNDRSLLRQRILAGLDVLKSHANVDASKLVAIGYCFGGTTVLELARSGADIKGVVSFHGGLSTPAPEDAQNIKAKILVLHGADDPFVPQAEVDAFEKEMKDASVDYALIAYPGAVHGFTNPSNTGEIKGALYDEQADQRSWKDMNEFFSNILTTAKNEDEPSL